MDGVSPMGPEGKKTVIWGDFAVPQAPLPWHMGSMSGNQDVS
jgi:hypothetical protein